MCRRRSASSLREGLEETVTLTRLGPGHTGFIVTSGYTAQGETTEGIQIFVQRPPHIEIEIVKVRHDAAHLAGAKAAVVVDYD